MQITIVSVGKTYPKGNATALDLEFINEKGSNTKRVLVGYGKTADVIKILKDSGQGEIWDIKTEQSKDGKFWNWIGAEPVAATNGSTKQATSVSRSNYETPEERAARQVYIVRQSSIANAIAFLGGATTGATREEIVETAKFFEDYIFGADDPPQDEEISYP